MTRTPVTTAASAHAATSPTSASPTAAAATSSATTTTNTTTNNNNTTAATTPPPTDATTSAGSNSDTTTEEVYIAVMGVTGAGKSTFIHTVTGDDSIIIGHELKSCTAAVSRYRFVHEGVGITLIDTPGFNDTTRGETEVLREIADWLALTYKNPPRIRLSGIVYMQALEDRRVYGSTLRNLKMFRELCGEKPMKNVIFTTTGWSVARKGDLLDRAFHKEEQLINESIFWEPMIRRGAQTARFEDSRSSAMDIVSKLVPRAPVTLQIQRELVDEDKNLIDTAAGTTVNEEIKRMEVKYKEELRQIQEEMIEALKNKDLEHHEALEETKAKIESLREDARRAQDVLSYERRNIERKYENEMQDLRVALEDTRLAAEVREEKIREDALAQRYEDQLQFEAIVAQIKANMDKVRREDRELLEKKIKQMEKQKGKPGRGKELLLGLLPAVGSVVLSVLGFGFGGNAFAGLFNMNEDETAEVDPAADYYDEGAYTPQDDYVVEEVQ